jgi:hypothetical protein
MEAFAAGKKAAEAAEAAGCSVATAKRRWARREFKDAVIELQKEQIRQREARRYEVWGLGEGLVNNGLLALGQILAAHDASDRDKIRAAGLLLRQFGPVAEPAPPHIPTASQEQMAAVSAQLQAEFYGSLSRSRELVQGVAGLSPRQQRMLVDRAAAEGVPVPAEVAEVLDPEVLQPDRPQPEPVYPQARAPHGEVYQPPPPQQRQPDPDGQAAEDQLEDLVEEAEEPPDDEAEVLPAAEPDWKPPRERRLVREGDVTVYEHARNQRWRR